MTKITSYLKPHYGMMALGLTIKFIGTIMDLLIPWFLSHIIDDVVPLGDMGRIFLWGGAMLVCSGLALVTNINANRMASRVARSTTRSIRHDLFKKISYLSCAQVDSFSVSSLESRLTSDTYNVHHVVGMTQRIGVRAPILLIGG
ncbi:MAG TPA: ABC transporter transmembrane domain-containing protein, partial [Oscillospiraceae bacterium]|nr:ABC transporter transmembrane domain-containing protein [Oscillospiraceae bacterium]